MVTVDDVREVCRDLPRSEEHLISDRVKFRLDAWRTVVPKKVWSAYLPRLA